MDKFGIIRHGAYDQMTSKLTTEGIEQVRFAARRVCLHVPKHAFVLIEHSPLPRTTEAAQIFAEEYARIWGVGEETYGVTPCAIPTVRSNTLIALDEPWDKMTRAAADGVRTWFAQPTEVSRVLIHMTHEPMLLRIPKLVYADRFGDDIFSTRPIPHKPGQGVLIDLGSRKVVDLGTSHTLDE